MNVIRISETLYIYRIDNQIEEMIEAAGTAKQKVTRFGYNEFGQKETMTKPDGVVIRYIYDAKGRLKTISSSDNTIGYTYEYDKNDQVIGVKDRINQLDALRTYNLSGQLESEKLGHGHLICYSYDRAGQLCQLDLPDQSSFKYIYNAANLTEIHRLKNNVSIYSHHDQSHNLSGHTTSAKLAGQNGMIHYQYDAMDRFTSITHPLLKQIVPKGGYDAAGNLLHYQSQAIDYRFTYDDLYQLKTENGHCQHHYESDSLSNRLFKDNQTHHINALNQLTNRQEETYLYDPNGNLKEKQKGNEKTTYDYDALNRLIGVKCNGLEIKYSYDAFNRRLIQQQVGQLEKQFIYVGQEEIGVWEGDKITELKVISEGKRSPAVTIELHGVTFIPLYDLFGNVICLNNLQGEVVERYAYSAFGEVEISDSKGNSLEKSLVDNPWRYANRRFDPDTGLIAFGLRYYDPDLGRWTTPDPAEFEDGPNLYAYVHNNPLVLFDQYGLFSCPCTGFTYFSMFGNEPPSMFGFDNSITQNPRFQGSMQAFGGLVEMGVGGGMTLATKGIAAPLGWPIMAHGLDHYITGMNIALSGNRRDTLTSQFLQQAGMSPETASLMDNGLGIFGTTGGAAAIRYNQVATFPHVSMLTTQGSTSLATTEARAFSQIVKEGFEIGQSISNHKVIKLEAKISEWLGKETRLIYNKAKDPVFMSKDGTRRVRFDFNNPHGDKPHLHIEQKINSNWKDASKQHRIYPLGE